jgi:hypothetical protein
MGDGADDGADSGAVVEGDDDAARLAPAYPCAPHVRMATAIILRQDVEFSPSPLATQYLQLILDMESSKKRYQGGS